MIRIELEIESDERDDVLRWMDLNLKALANFTQIQGRITKLEEIPSESD